MVSYQNTNTPSQSLSNFRMNIQQILTYSHIVVSVLLAAAVLLQQKGAGLSAAFGGNSGGFYRTKRGFEKALFIGTIVLGALFIIIGGASIYFHR